MLALLVAACFLLAWVLRLGWMADYFSRPVLIGYLHGVAVILVIGQLGKLLGTLDRRDASRSGGSGRWCGELGDVSGATVAVSVVSLAALFVPPPLSCPSCPAALIVVVVAIALSWALDLAGPRRRDRRPSRARPAAPDAPDARRSPTSSASCPAALGLFLVSFADEILTARAFAGKHRENVRASQELLTMGAANAAAGFTQGFSVGASGCAHRGERRDGCPDPDRRARSPRRRRWP